MERYVYRRRQDGIYVINLEKTYEKLQMAARLIVAIENPQDVVVQSARPYGQRAVFKFAQYLGCKSLAGRHTPGTFTNQTQKNFEEPRLLILTDPRTDHQPIKVRMGALGIHTGMGILEWAYRNGRGRGEKVQHATCAWVRCFCVMHGAQSRPRHHGGMRMTTGGRLGQQCMARQLKRPGEPLGH
jgi:hypothetical protein